jgi:tRNA(Ile)-lysidine synthase
MRSVTPAQALSGAFAKEEIPHDGMLLAAVSGGPDSMALLGALIEIAPRFSVPFAVGHVDHGWRGVHSARDAAFVESFCRRRGIEFLSARTGPPPSGRSREDAAREFRYRALASMQDSLGASGILTAHTRDDAAETLLLAVFRGRPLGGVSGIRRRRGDGIYRPFLEVSRETILEYLRRRRIPFRRDATNTDTSFERNWVRKRVVPFLGRRFGEAVTGNLAASAEALSRDREWIEAIFAREVLPLLEDDRDGVRAEASVLAGLPAAALRRALLAMADRAGGLSLSRAELLALEDRVRTGKPFRFQARRRVDFRSSRGRVSARHAAGKSM